MDKAGRIGKLLQRLDRSIVVGPSHSSTWNISTRWDECTEEIMTCFRRYGIAVIKHGAFCDRLPKASAFHFSNQDQSNRQMIALIHYVVYFVRGLLALRIAHEGGIAP